MFSMRSSGASDTKALFSLIVLWIIPLLTASSESQMAFCIRWNLCASLIIFLLFLSHQLPCIVDIRGNRSSLFIIFSLRLASEADRSTLRSFQAVSLGNRRQKIGVWQAACIKMLQRAVFAEIDRSIALAPPEYTPPEVYITCVVAQRRGIRVLCSWGCILMKL